MTTDKNTTSLLVQLKNILASWQQRAQAISTDPNVLHWKKVKIESFSSVIENLGLSPASLHPARDNYPNLAKEILKRVALLTNELHNLESDIKLGPLAPEIAQAATLKLEDQCKELKPDIDQLHGYHKTLAEGSKVLKEKLNFHSFIPQARLQAIGKKKSLVETGYTIYLTVSKDPGLEREEDAPSMFSYLDKVIELQKTIEQTEIPALPAITQSFLEQQLKLCLAGCEQIKLFINFVSDYFQSEMDPIKSFQVKLDRLKVQSLTELLLEIPSQTNGASKCLQRFTHKRFLLEDLQNAYRLLSSVETFHHMLVTHLIPYLEIQVDIKNGLLNPQTLAAARSHKYFTGTKGLWRFSRMLILAAGTQSILSEEQLGEKITEAINTCSFFFTQEAQDSTEINTFIDNFFTGYKRPFPHDELVDITRKSIIIYATILDKVFIKYKPKQSENEADQEEKVLTLGHLLGKIERRTENLEKYRQKFHHGK